MTDQEQFVTTRTDKMTKRRNKRKPAYTRETAMSANLRSQTETGKVLRSIGAAEGAPRAGNDAVEAAWSLVEQDRPQSEIKQVFITAAQMAKTANKRTITKSLIINADQIVKNCRRK